MSKSIRVLTVVLSLSLIFLSANPATAQYKRLDLVSNVSGAALHTDPNLINAWGLAFFPSSPFWVSDAGTGLSSLYGPLGSAVPLVVTIPSAAAGREKPVTKTSKESLTDLLTYSDVLTALSVPQEECRHFLLDRADAFIEAGYFRQLGNWKRDS